MRASDLSPEELDLVIVTAEGEDRAGDRGGGAGVERQQSSKELEPRGGEDGTATGAGAQTTGDGSARGRGGGNQWVGSHCT
jgi:hypothetical protein